MTEKNIASPSETVSSPENPDLERISGVLDGVSARQQEFLEEALTRGMSEDEISAAAKEAVSTGALPRIVRAVGMRDGVNRISVIHGTEVPPEALAVDFSKTEDGKLESISIQKSMMAPIPPTPIEGDPKGYYQEMFAIGSQASEEDLALAATRLESAMTSLAQ